MNAVLLTLLFGDTDGLNPRRQSKLLRNLAVGDVDFLADFELCENTDLMSLYRDHVKAR
jgi:hypothetical protein